MAEPDHIFVNPLPNLAHGDHPAAFPFFYITPAEHEKIVRKYYPEEKGPVTNVDPIGNSPVIIKKVRSLCLVIWYEKYHPIEIKTLPFGSLYMLLWKSYWLQSLLEKVAPTWMNVSLKMKSDPETDKVFGWVLEMYVLLKFL